MKLQLNNNRKTTELESLSIQNELNSRFPELSRMNQEIKKLHNGVREPVTRFRTKSGGDTMAGGKSDKSKNTSVFDHYISFEFNEHRAYISAYVSNSDRDYVVRYAVGITKPTKTHFPDLNRIEAVQTFVLFCQEITQ